MRSNFFLRHQRSTSIRRLGPVAAGVIGYVLLASSAGAQTRFSWPSKPANLEQYLTVEECTAAEQRVRDSVSQLASVRVDTLPPFAAEVTNPLAPSAKIVAQTCVSKFDPNTFPIQDGWHLLMQLYLHAGQSENAWTLLRQRLSHIPKDSILQRELVIDTAIDAWLKTPPVALSVVDSLLAGMRQFPRTGDEFSQRVWRNIALMRLARQAGDTVLMQRAAMRSSAAWDKRPAELPREALEALSDWMLEADATRERNDARDSLRKSTASYVAMVKRRVTRVAFGMTRRSPIGEQATAISADFWFSAASDRPDTLPQSGAPRSTPGNTGRETSPQGHPVRPTPGRIALVVFLSHSCNYGSEVPRFLGFADECIAPYSALRRFAKQYPAIEITLVAQTYGFFNLMDPLTPRQEADTLRAWWLGYHQLPGTLAVTNGKWWRLEDPDRRRNNAVNPNAEAYAFGSEREGLPLIRPGTGFLIDESGTIVHAGKVGCASRSCRMSERDFTDILDVLFARQRTQIHTSTGQ